ncbi:MAG: aminotransferase class I/II-fold pyridoxal phosphate-dependent enzyme [Ruminococcaceae bacterium]|nr:aminotransferase class I/II-fold pyridoxal phosphate-dependent enzyme [Oscillospiraceae bacterium]
MIPYVEMSREQLLQEKKLLTVRYEQFREQGLNLNMSRGIPCAEQLELSMPMLDIVNSGSDLHTVTGADCRNYGIVDGIPEVKKLFADLFGVTTDEIIVLGNSSLNMMFDTISSAMAHGLLGGEPWANQGRIKFLCPSPGYDRHFGITEYFDIDMIPIEINEDGPDMDTIEKLVESDPMVKGIWCVPKYSNPTGVTYSDETVMRMARLKPAAKDFRIFWDNAYSVHYLFGEDKQIVNILHECKKNGNPNMVYMYFSTSKITFPGAGLAGMATSLENVNAIKARMSVQTIGGDKINQLRHMRFFGNIDGLMTQMEKHAEILRPRFTAVQETLTKEIGDSGAAQWSDPQGGYFVSFDTMDGCARRTVELCAQAGVTLTPAGATYPYHRDPRDRNIRIAPTSPTIENLITAMSILAVCARLSAIEKLLAQ